MYTRFYPDRGSSRGNHRGGFRGGSRGGNAGRGRYQSGRPQPGGANQTATQRVTPRLSRGCYYPKHILTHFNPSVTNYDADLIGTINAGKDKPDGIGFALVYVSNQPQWMTENTLYIKSSLHLLPEYADKKAVLVAQHQAPTEEELMVRISAKLTESINFDRYGIEDGPDVECYGEDNNIVSLVAPGDWMAEDYDLPLVASVDTPSVKYSPADPKSFALYAGYGQDPNMTGFKFVAWFVVEEVELFAADSAALAARMRDKKWKADMKREWAAVKLRRINRDEPDWHPYPDINRRWGEVKALGEKKSKAMRAEERRKTAAGEGVAEGNMAVAAGETEVEDVKQEDVKQKDIKKKVINQGGVKLEYIAQGGVKLTDFIVEDVKQEDIDQGGVKLAGFIEEEVEQEDVKQDVKQEAGK